MIVSEGSPLEAMDLLQASVAFIRSLYPEEHNHTFSLEQLSTGRFFIARQPAIIGCGAYVWHDPHQVEIKHMFVIAEARGLGCGRALLMAIEQHAMFDKARRVVLETSKKQAEAIALYTSSGYVVCEPYTEHHAEDVFMMKWL